MGKRTWFSTTSVTHTRTTPVADYLGVLARPAPGSVPTTPGSYQFKDAQGRVIYVGKAANLRQRVLSYFADPATLHPRTAKMMASAGSLEWTQVTNEVEALILEQTLIARHRPRFNVRLKDSKGFPFIALTTDEPWPKVVLSWSRTRAGWRYFGPYPNRRAATETLELLASAFPLRSCTEAKFSEYANLGRPCLLFDLGRCAGPCAGRVDGSGYGTIVDDVARVLGGHSAELVTQTTAKMHAAAAEERFEAAAVLRDRLHALAAVQVRQQMVLTPGVEMDVIALALDEFEVAAAVFFVRDGRVIGRHGFVLERSEELDDAAMMHRALVELYSAPVHGIPPRITLDRAPADTEVLQQWLTELGGRAVSLQVPRRGPRRALLDTVARNATDDLAQQRLRRASDLASRTRALTELQDLLHLPEAPLRIECYDMAHLHGEAYVGAMVVLEDGLAAKSQYRKFLVGTAANDDYAAMREVLTRRFRAYLDDRNAPSSGARFAYPPQLVLVDGGAGQLGVARAVLETLGLYPQIAVAALAKRLEEVYRPGHPEPIHLPRDSAALYLLQHARDEAHRVANAYHQEVRDRRLTASVLDEIPGLGPQRRTRLLETFGTLSALRQAPHGEIDALGWLPVRVRAALWAALHPDADAGPITGP